MRKITILKPLLAVLLMATAPFSSMAQTFLQKSTGFPVNGTNSRNISIVDDNVVWAYGGNTTYFSISTDKGNTWTVSPSGLPASYLIPDLAALSATTAYIAVNDFANGLSGVYKTTNSGTLWVRQSTAAFDVNSFINLVQFFDASNGVAMGDPDDLGYFEIYTTANGGDLWTRVPQTSIPALLPGEYGLSSWYDQVGNTFWFMSSAKRLYKSLDKGLNWTSVAYDTLLPGSTGFSFSDANKGLMYSKDGSNLNLYRTLDGGATFTAVPLAGVSDIFSIEYIPGTTAVLLSGTGGVYYSNNDGNSWNSLGATVFTGALKFKNRNTGFGEAATVSPTNGGIMKFANTISLIGAQIGTPWTTDLDLTTTDGTTYTLLSQVLQAGGLKFRQNHEWTPGSVDWGSAAFPSGIGVNGGANIPVVAGTYDITLNVLTGAYNFSEVLAVSDFEKVNFKLFPNPADSFLTIHSQKMITNVTIYEPTGKKIIEIDNPEPQMDVSKLSSGIYLMRVTADGQIHQTKFIKK